MDDYQWDYLFLGEEDSVIIVEVIKVESVETAEWKKSINETSDEVEIIENKACVMDKKVMCITVGSKDVEKKVNLEEPWKQRQHLRKVGNEIELKTPKDT